MKYHALLFLLLLLASSCKTNKINTKECSSLSSTIDSIALNNNFNGVILVAKDSTIQYKKAFGYSDLGNKTELKTSDLFFIGSISKQITAVLILREYEKGNLKLTDKINKYLPINQPWADQVTIHHLLTHTHGIVEIDQPLEFGVGTKFHYSQIGFGLLSQILEKIYHKSFEEISTNLFNEYGLKNTFHPDNKNYKHLVKGYEENKNGKLIYAEGNPVKYIAAGGLISNVEDILKWNKLLYSGKLVKSTTLDLMRTRFATRVHPIFDEIEYGYGLLFKDKQQNIEIGAFGYSPGFPSAAYYYPQTNMNLIVLENIGVHLDDFKQTFKVHTDLMDLIKNLKL
ncbi:serine hydrolase domain-containing protein [Kaistella flava (ex Peng et al. 2021)]|nr:serine hydrolase domain-containing protein [Kaistella flava (ex Peng et al. 2021)]